MAGQKRALVLFGCGAFNALVVRLRRMLETVVLAVRNEDVRRAETVWGAAIVAEWVHFVALGVFAYRAGGASAVGLAGLVRLLPAAVVAPVAVSLGDRFRRERFLAGAALVGSLALAGSAAAAFAGVHVLVYLLAAVVGACSTVVRPTLQALLPSLARTPVELIAANGATSTIESVGTLAGPLAAGVLVALAPVGVAFAAAAVLLAASTLALKPVRTVRPPISLDQAWPDVVGGARPGFESIAKLSGARLVLGLMVAQTFVRGCLNVLIVVAAFRLLHAGAGAVGYLTAAIGFGGLLGAVRAMTLRGRRLAVPFAVSLACWGLPIALVAPAPRLASALVLLGIVGAANSIEDITGFTLVQRAVPDELLHRVLGIFWGVAMGAVAVGSAAAPSLVHAFGPKPSFLLVGSLLPLLAIATYRGLARVDTLLPATTELALLEGVAMFAPLSLSTKERLAGRLHAVRVQAGDDVIRAGESGDRFYIIGHGDFAVNTGSEQKKLGAGDFFGEIALLHDLPRTATITATTEALLYALQRHDFLAAITGHAAAERAAANTVEARLSTAS